MCWNKVNTISRKTMSNVDLGFPEERINAAQWLCNRYFPSKVGGKPAWLELETLPSGELKCSSCEQTMAFLCQIYASGEDEHNFHRSIFLFVCRDPSCQKPNDASNFIALRSQLPLINDFYSTEPPKEDGEPLPPIPAKKKLCAACGCVGPFACGKCRNVNYCSSKHQSAMWPSHKAVCGTGNIASTNDNAGILFPECEIVLEAEEKNEEQEKVGHDKDEKQRLEEFQKLAVEGKTGTFKDLPDEELEKYAQTAESVDDKFFRRFKKVTSKEPDQILRYQRGGAALWIADIEKTVAKQLADVPPCELCGAAREFEFEILPQMLLLLKDEHLDWGIVAVYTCPLNCRIPSEVGYAKEYVVKQDIVGDK